MHWHSSELPAQVLQPLVCLSGIQLLPADQVCADVERKAIWAVFSLHDQRPHNPPSRGLCGSSLLGWQLNVIKKGLRFVHLQ